MELRQSEILRYAGFRGHTPDEAMLKKIEQLKEEALASVTPRSIFKDVAFRTFGDDCFLVDGVVFKSRKLTSQLKTAKRLLLFAATLGPESDRLLRKYSVSDRSKYVLTQAILTEMIESYSNEICDGLAEKYKNEGLYLMPRFSAGYADLELTAQKSFFELLDISKRIGVTLNDECLMTPSKSVTAFIGLGTKPFCAKSGCSACDKTDCEFRRE